eukprot:TRINITY_DN4609_c1_g1_i2.p1 TRINITY_DN4609_c1_g1~~TRINITY_DN4609_c1_g1_i2.p1  ORF type:complete len:214 (+),score=27.03 TRINITY_DN4609_c1_g1_i2:306-947(+)
MRTSARIAPLGLVGRLLLAHRPSEKLDLESVGPAASAGLLELATLRAHVRLDRVVGVQVVDGGPVAEVPDSLASVLGAAEEHGVGALGRPERQLVKGDALSASREDASAGGLGEPEGAHGKLGHFEEADVIRHGPHKHRRAGLLVPHVPRQAGEGQGRAVGLRHIQTLQDHLGERAVRPAGKEPEQLNQQAEVHIVRLGRRADLVSDTPATGH